jgi:hypothetical protein
MECSTSKRVTSNTTSPNSHYSPTETPQRPNKVQKINNSIAGFSGNVLNIPEFIGPTPIIQFQHHNNNESLKQQERNGQEGRTGQETPRTPHQSPDQFTTNNRQNTSPNSTEDPFCWYQEDHVQEGIQNCKKSLIGKFLTEKIITKQVVHNTLLGIWGNPKGFQITEVEGGFYHISMENERDILRALKGNSWTVGTLGSWFNSGIEKETPKNWIFKEPQYGYNYGAFPFTAKPLLWGNT